MERRLFLLVVAALCIFSGVQSAKANDSVFYGYGANVYPVHQADIKMDYELLTITVNDAADPAQKRINVDVHFVFRNLGAEKTVTVGFTEWAGAGDISESEALTTAHDFATSVDGIPVEAVPQLLAKENTEYGFERVHLWRMHFEEGQSRTVHNTYWLRASQNVERDWWTGYILKTGGLWAGSIGRIDVFVKARERVVDYAHGDRWNDPPQYWMPFVPYPEEYSEFHAVNWKPNHDIRIESNQLKDNMLYRRTFAQKFNHAEREKAVRERRALIRSYIAGLSDEQLSTCSRNELQSYINGIFATYGREFQSPEWSKFFTAKWWYDPNPAFRDTLLSDRDRRTITRLQGYLENALATQTKP